MRLSRPDLHLPPGPGLTFRTARPFPRMIARPLRRFCGLADRQTATRVTPLDFRSLVKPNLPASSDKEPCHEWDWIPV